MKRESKIDYMIFDEKSTHKQSISSRVCSHNVWAREVFGISSSFIMPYRMTFR